MLKPAATSKVKGPLCSMVKGTSKKCIVLAFTWDTPASLVLGTTSMTVPAQRIGTASGRWRRKEREHWGGKWQEGVEGEGEGERLECGVGTCGNLRSLLWAQAAQHWWLLSRRWKSCHLFYDCILTCILVIFIVASFVPPPRWHLGWTGRALQEGPLRGPGSLPSRQGRSSGRVHSLDFNFSLLFFLAMNNCYLQFFIVIYFVWP